VTPQLEQVREQLSELHVVADEQHGRGGRGRGRHAPIISPSGPS
jgi:hypothetical protein